MNRFKKISAMALGGIIILATTSFGKTGTVNAPNGLILRKEASKSGEVVMTISDKSSVEILDESGEWYKVKYNDNEGYLFAEYVDAEKEEETEKTEGTEESTEEQKEETNAEEVKSTDTENKKYPQKQTTKANLKIYTIPSVTGKTIDDVKKGEEITINYELNNWVNVTYGKKQGWARKYFVNDESTVVEETTNNDEETDKTEQDTEKVTDTNTDATVIENKKGYVDVSNSANIREKASTSSNVVTTLLRNTEVTITAEEGDFYKIQYKDITGYISKSLISDKPVAEVTSRSSGERKVNNNTDTETENKESEVSKKTETKSTTSSKTVTSTSSTLSAGSDVVSYAKKYIGYKYVYGGTSPSSGFDCSGFTYYVYNSCGYSLSRSCQVQANSGTAVSRKNLSAGDLVFFDNGSNGSIGHVGIYIGGGQFIHAENSRTGVRTDTLNSGYYNKYYYSARRMTK